MQDVEQEVTTDGSLAPTKRAYGSIGIDLGTTNTSCATLEIGANLSKERGSVSKPILNERGSRVTPSYVYIQDTGEANVGVTAQEQAEQKPDQVFFDAKRFIGNKISADVIQRSLDVWSFKIECDADNNPLFVWNSDKKVKSEDDRIKEI